MDLSHPKCLTLAEGISRECCDLQHYLTSQRCYCSLFNGSPKPIPSIQIACNKIHKRRRSQIHQWCIVGVEKE
ncbi:hypothetical protein QJS10_CPA09g02072 [Acorus calamus]|uniref:Uncharacterized protein n=1 Tax=Acorus calamus TaxID=4465 RepID=A0AAV9E3A3_ACOCL|nr:hypothetical protein QJS10_CPA09g02072 [Acorus calamus]